MQVTGQNEALQVQVESEEAIPQVVQHLAAHGASILKVNPRNYTLEDIYFALQAGEK
jgi:biotin operon repressor